MDALEDLLRQARELVDRGDYGGAEGLLLPEREGGNPEVLYLLGLVCYLLEKHQEAVDHLNRAISLRSDYVLALARRGMAYRKLGQEQEARTDFERAITIPPQDHKDWRGRGDAFNTLKQHEEAIASYDKAIEIKPDFHLAWFYRGNALLNLGRNEEAIASYDKALEIKPDFHEAWYNRGIALVNLGKYEEAIASYDKALEIKPDKHEAWNGRGSALFHLEKEKYPDAIASFDKALEIKPDFHEAWYNRGLALKNLGRNEEAIASYDKALEIKPDKHEAWNNWRILSQNGLLSFQDWLRVQQHCERGLEKISFEEEPQRHLDIWKYYLAVCSRTRSPEQTTILAYDAGNCLNRYLVENSMSEWKEQRFKERFAMFQQVGVSTLAQAGALEKALELAEEHRNYRLGWLLQGQGYQPRVTTYEQAQQLLNPQTAIIYWHYSPVGLTTFVLKHHQPLQILPPPPVAPRGIGLGSRGNEAILEQVQALEKWLASWKQAYLDYGKLPADQPQKKGEHPWQTQMQSRLNNPNKGSGSLKLVLNIKQLTEEYLQGIDHLILIPHRDLHLLPLHTLFPFGGYTTTYLPSLQVGLNLQTLSQIPSTDSLLNIHQPTGSPFIEITKDIINHLSNAEKRPLPSLSKTEFLQLLGTRHGALQFTGHGSHKPEEPENSYLNLPDEPLLLKDLRHHPQLDLSSYRLICLAACESGITSNNSLLDEYIGWGSAFLGKQARAVISTLWNVDVRSSAFLMIKFYEIFTKYPQKSAPRALREAQSWLSTLDYEGLADWYDHLATMIDGGSDRDYLLTEANKLRNDQEKMMGFDRPFTNPYHWAGFVCTGLLEQ